MAGTAIQINQGTQTNVAGDSVGGTLFQAVKIDIGANGASSPFTGTLLQVTNLAGGTLSSIPNIPGGTIGSVVGIGAIPNIPGGTLGVVSTVTTVSNLTNGSITILSGTLLNTGTTVNIASGTQQTLGTVGVINSGTLAQVTTVSNITNGSIHVTAGTEVITSGTINVGTTTTQLNPLPIVNTISHAGTSGTVAIGTLVAAIGSGTAIYPTNFRIVVLSGTAEVCLSFGSVINGNQVVHHGLYPAGGGIANPIPYPHGYGTTNSPLTYQIISGSGTVSWDIDYFTHT